MQLNYITFSQATVCLVYLAQLASSMMVYVNYTSHFLNDSNKQMPDDVTLTLNFPGRDGESTEQTDVTLKRSEVDPNVPIYTMTLTPDGKYKTVREKLKKRSNVGFFQDVSSEAMIKITRLSGLGEENTRLLLQGELSLHGQRYSIDPKRRQKRDTSSSPSSLSSSTSSGELYEFVLEPNRAAPRFDYLNARPEVKLTISETLKADSAGATITQVHNERENDTASTSSSTSSSSSSSSQQSYSSSNRQKRQRTAYYVDIVAVIDYGAYRRFSESSAPRTETLENIREYYAFIFNGIDLRYQSITTTGYAIRTRLTKIIVTQTSDASSFTENYRVSSRPWDEVDASRALTAMSQFARESGADILLPYDHAMLFIGYDLTSFIASTSTTTNQTTGLAYTSTLCRTDGMSVSIVEDLGGFQCVDTATHELGHSLSARHDGDNNRCRSSDRYIMAGGTYPETEQNRLHPWEFSTCSIDYFVSFTSSQMTSSRGATCLTQPLPISASVPNVADRLPGQEVGPDDQCRMIYGSTSRLCRGVEFGSNICTSMFCFDPTTTGTCFEQVAARGTTCGNGKLCIDGECKADARAPSVNDNCLFGDQPGTAFDGQTCADFVGEFSGYCYQELVRGRCCNSCQKAYRLLTNCEYGDTVTGCRADVCPFGTTRYLQQCCGTCNYGTPFTTTTQGPVVTTPRPTTVVTTIATTTTTETTTRNPNVCVDNANVLVNRMPCSRAIESDKSLCYQEDVLEACCASCRDANSGVAGCEYGDHYPVGCSRISSCENVAESCCETCGALRPTTTAPPEETTTTETTTPEPTTPRPVDTTAGPQCVDNPLIQVNRMPCAIAISSQPDLCYNIRVREDCCSSCASVYTGVRGCEYGDLFPEECKSVENCEDYREQCCQTCSRTGSSSPPFLSRGVTPNLYLFSVVSILLTSFSTRLTL